MRNRVLTDVYEPGSIMKPFILGLALDRGKVEPTTVIDTSAGRMTIAGRSVEVTLFDLTTSPPSPMQEPFRVSL